MKNIRHYKENVKRHVLIVEDEFINQQILGNIISSEFEPIYASNGKEALHIIKDEDHFISLVLLDLNMPVMDGYQLLEIMMGDERLKRIPVIVLTSEKSAEIKSLQLGAQDFIVKPYDMPEIILARVRRSILLAEETDIILRTEKDSLTGLTTKKYFYEYINEYDEQEPNAKMDAIAINIKKFHTINEMFGRRLGDELLIAVAHVLKDAMEKYGGIVSRVESDTFYLYVASQENYQELILEALEEANNRINIDQHIDFKIGINRFVDKSLSIEKRFDDALRALRLNDDSLANTIVVYDQQMHEKELFNEKLLLEFDKSIKDKQFKIYLQPKMDITGDKPVLCSAEALVRWIHPVYGLISPGLFIPLLENNGLIQKLDRYIWNEAALQIQKWKEEFGVTLSISVNVSRVDLFNEHLPKELLDIVKEHKIDVDKLYLEVTESAAVGDTAQIMKNVKELQKKGFVIEMDDFGTGYSSLHMVSALPLDALKIDMSFIRNLFSSEKDKRMVQIILEIAKLLNAKTVAEGVENIEQVKLLKEMGVDIIQGYYFSKPLPVDEFNDKYMKR